MRLPTLAALAQLVVLATAIPRLEVESGFGEVRGSYNNVYWYWDENGPSFRVDGSDGCGSRNVAGLKTLCMDRINSTFPRAHYILDGQGDKDKHCLLPEDEVLVWSSGTASGGYSYQTSWREKPCTW